MGVSSSIEELSPFELKAKMDAHEDMQLVDVRDKDEYDVCHLPNAKLIPIDQLLDRFHELDKRKPVVLYCHHGNRSFRAAMTLEDKGFKVAHLQGGIEAWSREVDPTCKRYESDPFTGKLRVLE
jgi:adenylyltransferase/sulfurtransferase